MQSIKQWLVAAGRWACGSAQGTPGTGEFALRVNCQPQLVHLMQHGWPSEAHSQQVADVHTDFGTPDSDVKTCCIGTPLPCAPGGSRLNVRLMPAVEPATAHVYCSSRSASACSWRRISKSCSSSTQPLLSVPAGMRPLGQHVQRLVLSNACAAICGAIAVTCDAQ